MRCASLDLAPAGPKDGFYAGGGELLASACRECGFVAAPLVFETPERYAAFRRAKRGLPGQERSAAEASQGAERLAALREGLRRRREAQG
jgi:hypothetical protein